MKRAAPFAFCVLGLFAVFHPTLLSGFAQVQTDLGDSRLVNFILEHSFRWWTSRAELWSPGFFWPEPGTFAWSETLLGVAPPYWLLRGLGADHYLAFQLWAPILCVLNFAAFYRLLRGPAALDVLPSSVGAWFFAFCALRANQLCHHQLLGVFWGAWAIHALCLLMKSGQWRWALLSGLAIGGQLLAGWYLGWMLIFGLTLAVPLRLFWKHPRLLVGVGSAVTLGAVVASPVLWHQFQAMRQFGGYDSEMAAVYVPHWWTWFDMGPGSWLFRWTSPGGFGEVEHRVGLGLLAAALAVFGLLKRKRLDFIIAGVAIAAVSMLSWGLVRAVVPGATSIRAVARIGCLLVFPASLGLAYVTAWASSRRWLYACLLLLFAEQLVTTESFDKETDRANIERIAEMIRSKPDCVAFFFEPEHDESFPDKYQIDAMWASLETGVPTINGYSGHYPRGWGLFRPSDSPQTQALLSYWLEGKGIARGVCVVREKT